MAKPMKRKQFEKMLRDAGWTFDCHGGEHDMWVKKSSEFAVPRHSEIKAGIVGAWQKKNANLDKEDE